MASHKFTKGTKPCWHNTNIRQTWGFHVGKVFQSRCVKKARKSIPYGKIKVRSMYELSQLPQITKPCVCAPLATPASSKCVGWVSYFLHLIAINDLEIVLTASFDLQCRLWSIACLWDWLSPSQIWLFSSSSCFFSQSILVAANSVYKRGCRLLQITHTKFFSFSFSSSDFWFGQYHFSSNQLLKSAQDWPGTM